MYICTPFRELSSAGSEHLPYKQGVNGSNPLVPTNKCLSFRKAFCFMEYFVYILFSKGRNCYYVGSTSNLEGRLRRHNTDHSGFTGSVSDWVISLALPIIIKFKLLLLDNPTKIRKI